jgi:hypothetical protein
LDVALEIPRAIFFKKVAHIQVQASKKDSRSALEQSTARRDERALLEYYHIGPEPARALGSRQFIIVRRKRFIPHNPVAIVKKDRTSAGKKTRMSQLMEDRLFKEKKKLLACLGMLQNGRRMISQADQSSQIGHVTT